jgi:hypothetical protein
VALHPPSHCLKACCPIETGKRRSGSVRFDAAPRSPYICAMEERAS